MKIENLIGSLSAAIQQSYKICEMNSLNMFLTQYFEESNSLEDTYAPKTIKIALPTASAEENDIDEKVVLAPVAALVKHNNMNIDYVKLNINVSVSEEKDNQLNVKTEKNSYDGDSAENDKTGELEIMFKRSDASEGIARVETYLNGML